ncbi:hypothetical protein BDQ17DRAFT_1235282 [Cyathus striatus]|nr:hypothetical protein BDQ17DRAFT_1235282 [Cyathus striatus]
MSIAPSTFLKHIQNLYPSRQINSNIQALAAFSDYNPALSNPWYIIAAVAYSASNRPQGAPSIFNYVWQELKVQNESVENQRLLARKLREAIFKSGLISGYSKAINSLAALHEVMPEEFRESGPLRHVLFLTFYLVRLYLLSILLRDFHVSLEHYDKIGVDLFNSIYGNTAEPTQNLLDTIYPDLAGAFSRTIGYGLIYGHTEILSPIETSYTLVAALIAADTPLQIGWHLNGAQRLGATFEEVKAVREIAVEVVKSIGKQWENEVPEVTLA